MKIIYGTGNKEKVNQVSAFCKAIGKNDIEFMSQNDIGFTDDIVEKGETFEENSMIKAKAIKKYCDENDIKEIIVTDDAGLCVECLNGAPGVYSGRWASADGLHKTSQEACIDKLFKSIEEKKTNNRKAKFVCVLTVIFPNGEMKQFRGETIGKIAKKPGTMGKLTYGPVFIPDGFNRVMNELTPEELGTTHREKAFMELLKQI